ncbi:MAG: hypothetical protein LQ351_005193 [Letrouitia transgressa]|nr:MAG: hypothetical protein LQ351_005193 [Letrouitia transgressa]
MTQHNQSLLTFLRQSNPKIKRGGGPRATNTTCEGVYWETPTAVKPWKDFNLVSLNAMYGGCLREVLRQNYNLRDYTHIPKFPFCEIYNENTFEALLLQWNHPVISDALAKAQDCSEGHLSRDPIYMARGGLAKVLEQGPTSKGTEERKGYKRPDWAGIFRSKSWEPQLDMSTKYINVLPGDTKLSKNWKSKDIPPGPTRGWKRNNILYPLNQIYTYCIRANGRYGYVITDEELVVVRVRGRLDLNQNSSDESKDSTKYSETLHSGILEYRAIPWAWHDSSTDTEWDGLTVNLALWFLHLMAAAERGIEARYVPLKNMPKPTASFDSFTSFESESHFGNDTQELRTPPPQEIGPQEINQSFRSATSGIRAHLSNTKIGSQGSKTRQTSKRPTRKRSRSDRIEDLPQLDQHGRQKRRAGLRNRT